MKREVAQSVADFQQIEKSAAACLEQVTVQLFPGAFA